LIFAFDCRSIYELPEKRFEIVTADRIKELAAGFASGGLEAAEMAELRTLLEGAVEPLRAEAREIINAAALTALMMPQEKPSAGVRERLLKKVSTPDSMRPALMFIQADKAGDWIPLKVPGAWVKLLTMDDTKDYAVVLGKLDAGAKYPAHHHSGPEEIYILSGDLHIGETKLVAGDFHTAAPGSRHEVNHSETGCVILAVLTKRDLQAQFAAQ
jgi:anti-sigma factor ChrR (cupin superfamily)